MLPNSAIWPARKPHPLRLPGQSAADGRPAPWPDLAAGRHAPLLRAAARVAALLAWAPPACLLQAVLLRLPGSGKVRFARFFWMVICRVIGLSVRVRGKPADTGARLVFVSNHSSWLDIPALGSRLSACFVSKDDVARWPAFGTIARLGRTVFVSRTRASTGRERDEMLARLAAGDDLILFPEGTSSDGARVLPFRSSFFSLFETATPPLIQPVSIVYDRLEGLPALRSNRAVFAWYGDMDLAPHLWRLLRARRFGATIVLHPPVDPACYRDRKLLAQAVWQIVADGAAALRQNRGDAPARPG